MLLPELIIHEAKQDAWISAILLIGFASFSSGIYYFLAKRMGNQNLITFTQEVLGKFLSFPIIIILIFYFIIINGTIVREVAEVMKGVYLPKTPLWFFNSTIILTSAILVYYGLEVIARSFEIIFYLFLASVLIVVLSLIKVLSFSALQPILENGVKPVLQGAYPGTIFFSELFIILILAPQIIQKNKLHKILIGSISFIGLIFIIIILLSIMLFGPELAANLTFPLLSAHRYVQIFNIIERLDPLFIFYWIGGGIFKVSIFLYATVYLSQHFFKLSNYYLLIPFFIPALFYISFYYFDNVAQLNSFIINNVHYFVIVQLLYPALLLIVSKLRGIKFK